VWLATSCTCTQTGNSRRGELRAHREWLIFLVGLVSTGPLALWQVPLFANALARPAPATNGVRFP
jgi:hypothetical protein